MSRYEVGVETRERKDEMYLDNKAVSDHLGGCIKIGTYANNSAEKEHSHECHETTFKPLLAIFKGEAEVDDIP